MTEAAFNQIRQYGRSSPAVTIHLLEVIGPVVACTSAEAHRAALLRQARMIERDSEAALPAPEDREEVKLRYRQARDQGNG